MEFNTIIKNKFARLLISIGFNISEETKNSLTFKSDNITIKFSYNPFENEYIYFIKLNNQTVTYENFIVEGFLKVINEPVFGLKTQDDKIELWATQTLNYFEAFKDTLLKGEKNFYSGLNDYSEQRSKEYNKKFNVD